MENLGNWKFSGQIINWATNKRSQKHWKRENMLCICVHKLTSRVMLSTWQFKKYKRGETFNTHYIYLKCVNILGRDLGGERELRRHGHRREYNIKYVLK
jgi:hypothetical protein